MKKVAIVGVGPTGIYTFHSLVERGEPLEIVLYEQGEEAGVGMPYNDEHNSAQMLANIASIEIPPIYFTARDPRRLLSRSVPGAVGESQVSGIQR